jgi:hypothetical protein
MFPFAVRSLYENLLKALAVHEEQERQRQFAEQGWELFPMPIKKWKAYKEPRVLDELDFIVTHVTAVRGGFGVSKRAVSKWLKILRGDGPNVVNPTGHPVIDLQLTEAGVWAPSFSVKAAGLTSTEDAKFSHYFFEEEEHAERLLQELARRLALWERYRSGVPYHQIGAANGDNLANRELEHVTWHGSLGNFGVGWALDVAHDQELEPWHIETGRAALETLYYRILVASARARAKGVKLAPHRAFSPSRRVDTDFRTHREIVLPCVRKLDGLEVDYTMRKGKGRPVPITWDKNALYDARGRRIQ